MPRIVESVLDSASLISNANTSTITVRQFTMQSSRCSSRITPISTSPQHSLTSVNPMIMIMITVPRIEIKLLNIKILKLILSKIETIIYKAQNQILVFILMMRVMIITTMLMMMRKREGVLVEVEN
jgi:hypothetical protein